MSGRKKEKTTEDQSAYIRRGYLIEKPVAKAIKVMAAHEGLKDYEVVNKVLRDNIPEKYFNGD